MSDSFYIALAAAIGAFFTMIPAGIMAYATLVKVQQLKDDTAKLATEMNGHMSKVLEATAAGKLAEGELKGRADKTAEVLSATIRLEAREDAKTLIPQEATLEAAGMPSVSTSAATVADAQKTAKDAQSVARGAQTVAKNLTEEAK